MAANKQLDRLVSVVRSLEKGLQSSIKALQKNVSALSGKAPKVPKKDLVKALERLRKALNQAILALEKKITGAPVRKKSSGRKRAAG
jgi:exonuclease VII small subunit